MTDDVDFVQLAECLIEKLARKLAPSEADFVQHPDVWRHAASKSLVAGALARATDEQCGDPSPADSDDDDAMWSVTRAGMDPMSCTSATIVMGYNDGDRGRIAMHFAQDDDAGWASDGTYDEMLWVRRCKPEPEALGLAVRVQVSRVVGTC